MTMAAEKVTKKFAAEVNEVLSLVIHSLYGKKEIFLRELISNASDAIDKIRYESVKNANLLQNDADLKINITFDKEQRTITISDNGIGMSFDEVISNIGTIAKSGTKEFLQKLTGDERKDAHLIGQFGVGFYSAFIVADKVTVKTRKAGLSANEGVEWESDGTGEYTIENINREQRGTDITLHLKAEEEEFLSEYRLRHIITTYSDHITVPIYMQIEDIKDDEAVKESKDDSKNESATYKMEVVNKATALWTRPKAEIKDEDYKELYKHAFHDFQDPLVWSHNRVEGKYEYINLLFIPSHAPFDLYQAQKPRDLKLFVKRVFIMDDAEQFLPHYLRFIRGIIDSNDLPLNVSREILQNNKVVESIKGALTKKILSVLEDMASNDKEKYATFWKEFGQVLKEGPAEDFVNKDRIAKLLRFASTNNNTATQDVSLQDYVARMKPEQKKIYFVSADTFNAAKNSPHIEYFRKQGIEVLLLSDRVDEWLMAHLTEFDGKPLQSITRGELDLEETTANKDEAKQKQQQAEQQYSDVLAKVKESLKDVVEDVRLTARLTDSPSCVVVAENAMTSQMERLLKAAGQNVPTTKPILELNPEHFMMQKLQAEVNNDNFGKLARVLYDQAVLAEGGQLEDPAGFVKNVNSLMALLNK